MDIFFCDECGTRVSDLDLRGGKGMRQRNDVICTGCVDQGHAASWLARTGQGATANGHAAARSSAAISTPAVAVAEPPDIISAARDRAGTMPDDPFAAEAEEIRADQPAPRPPAHETDAIPARPPVRQAPQLEGLAAIAGGFDALAGSSTSVAGSADGAEDDLADRADDEDPATTPSGTPVPVPVESPFDAADQSDGDGNPGKAVTEEVPVQRGEDKSKVGSGRMQKGSGRHPTPSGRHQTASGRQAAQKRGSTTSKRAASSKTTRRSTNPMQSKKVLLLSLASCGLMILVFFGLVLPNVNKPHVKQAATEMDEPLKRVQDRVNEAKTACGAALQADEMAPITRAYDAVQAMRASFYDFQAKANKEGWSEDNYAQQLRLMGYYEVQSMFVEVQHRRGIIEQRGQ